MEPSELLSGTEKHDIEPHGEPVLADMNRPAVLNTDNNEETFLQDFKNDLVNHYQARESTIPISPLVENHDVPLDQFYIQPPIFAVETRCSPKKTSILSYKDIFFNQDKAYKHIYITAQAGMGKTSFSKQIAISWCHAHSSRDVCIDDTNENVKLEDNDKSNGQYENDHKTVAKDIHFDFGENFENDDYEVRFEEGKEFANDFSTLLKFEFLFLLHLRDYQETGECNIEDMIWKMITNFCTQSEMYSKQMLQNILREKRCLIITDGLDEWSHPEKTCVRNERIPHLKPYKSCTILTTTRQWKMSVVGLKSQQIDRHLEITRLDKSRIKKLALNALTILNKIKRCQRKPKSLNDFVVTINAVKPGDIITFPYIFLQFICLWHDDRELGRSKSEIYRNIIEFALEMGLLKSELQKMLPQEKVLNTILPINTDPGRIHIPFLTKLARLAFCSLFNILQESALNIDSKTALQYMDKKELEFFWKIGLLSQIKDPGFISKESFIVSFQHKSIQEYFAALHMTLTWQNEETHEIIRNLCTSVRDILEFAGVICFVCGINTDVYARLSKEIQIVVANDKVTQDYRQIKDCSDRDILRSYQSLQVSCFRENEKNINQVEIPLQDIIIDNNTEEIHDLKNIVKSNAHNVKSLYLRATYNLSSNVKDILQIVRDNQSLESLIWYIGCEDFLAEILAGSACTLKYVQIEGGLISSSIIDSILVLSNVQGITLQNECSVKISHNDMERLCVFLGETTTLTHIKLNLKCKDHFWNCPVFSLNLSRLCKLQKIHLLYGHLLSELHINTESLEECVLNANRFSAKATSSLLNDLRRAPVLSSLTLWNINFVPEILVCTITTLLQLKSLTLWHIDLGDSVLYLPPEMSQLEMLNLGWITLTNSATESLISRTIPTLVQLKCLTLDKVCLFDSVLSLPPAMKKLEKLKLLMITMNKIGWRRLISDICRLPQPVTVELDCCQGLSDEWNDIENEMKSFPISLNNMQIFPDLTASLAFQTIR